MKIAKAESTCKKPIIQSSGVIYSGRNIPKDFCDLKVFVSASYHESTTESRNPKTRRQCSCPRVLEVLTLLWELRQQVFPVGIAVGVVHRAERLAGCAGGVSVLGLCLAMCYISKPKPRNNLYTKNMLIWILYHRKYFLSIWVQKSSIVFCC